jgi:hypothetical protein
MISRWLNDAGNSLLSRLVYPTPDHDLPHIHVLECDTGSCISTYHCLATHRDSYATGASKAIAFLLGASTKSSSTKMVIQKAHWHHLTRAIKVATIRPCITT